MGHRRRRNGVVGAIHRRGDVREVREGGGRGAARGVGVGWEARRREAAALKHTGDAARRGRGEGGVEPLLEDGARRDGEKTLV